MRQLLPLNLALFSVAASAQSTSNPVAQPNAGSGAVRGSGTVNFIPKWISWKQGRRNRKQSGQPAVLRRRG